jgi:hypothetical protein
MNRREFLSISSAIAATAAVTSTSSGLGLPAAKPHSNRIPIIDVTDLYHPFQDPGDNLDLVYAFAFPQVDLRAVLLDATNAFRLPVSNAPFMWHDPNGPREPGIIPVTQLNYLFDRQVPYAVGPFTAMRCAEDKLLDVPVFQQAGIRLLLETLAASEQPVEILSFGSTRTISAAFNREPDLVRRKVARIHVSAGTAATNFELGGLRDQNEMPGGEWNVALDPWAFIRLLQSDLPIAIYPCSTKDGAFSYGRNNTYWKFQDLSFFTHLDRRLRNYVIYALARMNRPDFLACLEGELPADAASGRITHPHHVWETAVWLNVTRQKLIRKANNEAAVVPAADSATGCKVIQNSLVPCEVHVRSDGRFAFHATEKKSNFSIFQRDDPDEYEAASREAFMALWLSFRLP